MSSKHPSVAINFWIADQTQQFAFRRLHYVPREGEVCVFNDKRFVVIGVEWCLDENATDVGIRVNIELGEVKPDRKCPLGVIELPPTNTTQTAEGKDHDRDAPD